MQEPYCAPTRDHRDRLKRSLYRYSCVDATSAGGKPAFLREAPSPDPRSAKKRGPVTHIEVEAERIMSSVLRLTSNSIDGLEVLSSELRQLRTFLKSEVERGQSEIESALAGIRIIIDIIAPWVRAVRAGAILNPHNFVGDR